MKVLIFFVIFLVAHIRSQYVNVSLSGSSVIIQTGVCQTNLNHYPTIYECQGATISADIYQLSIIEGCIGEPIETNIYGNGGLYDGVYYQCQSDINYPDGDYAVISVFDEKCENVTAQVINPSGVCYYGFIVNSTYINEPEYYAATKCLSSTEAFFTKFNDLKCQDPIYTELQTIGQPCTHDNPYVQLCYIK
ncbi:hypothetical protein DICPUDRAFT_81307 [Dictyostelium purpureum]|uniref:Transmembrane protein n=1 Tax=Dictyostelium purpureum TaxID=5786 RepID=F0ZT36_DICPU|nr:uncharacterized protein DICPUDRAFT_81307 [Dictyostelium purpureum]EGC32899.1 hypothetical protein DICPUDRAFT_81307 [Dictyostelium purpureum]|eukprot:XP_003290584.1 hypothetical protein DICPUDRAFT_81307 [Dictyostelium purpureum]